MPLIDGWREEGENHQFTAYPLKPCPSRRVIEVAKGLKGPPTLGKGIELLSFGSVGSFGNRTFSSKR